MKTEQKILVIQTAFIGDIALTIFFANEIKQLFPDCELHFITTKIGYEILKCFKIIDRVIIFDKRNSHKGFAGIKNIAKQINADINTKNKYDFIFSLHRSFRSAILTKLINANEKIGFNINSFSFLLTKVIKYQKRLHEVERNRQCLSILKNFDKNFDYSKSVESIVSSFVISKEDIEIAKQLINNLDSKYNLGDRYIIDDRYIIVAPGSVWATKRWKPEYFTDLCKKFFVAGYKVFLIGSESEIELCREISHDSNAISLAGRTTIPQILEIIRNASLLVSNDSAPTHFASIFNIPTVTIFGATASYFGFSPLANNSIVVENDELFCRPCSPHGEKKCKRKHFDCMNSIKPELIFDKAINILAPQA